MEVIAIVLGVGLLLAVGVAVWALLTRAKAVAEVAAKSAATVAEATALRAAAEQARAQAEALLSQTRAEVERVRVEGARAMEDTRREMAEAVNRERAALEQSQRAAREEVERVRAEGAGVAAREREQGRAEVERREALLREARGKIEALEVGGARLQEQIARDAAVHEEEMTRQREVLAEQLRGVERRERDLREKFDALQKQAAETFKGAAGEALRQLREQFQAEAKKTLEAQQERAAGALDTRKVEFEKLVGPIQQALARTEAKLAELEQSRTAAYATVFEQVKVNQQAVHELREETGKLVRALREPQVRGRYGEMQLKRVAEIAGMRAYCDFCEQDTTRDSDGNVLRPDMVIRMPNGREIAVDSKATLRPYLDAIEATEPDVIEGHLVRFAEAVAGQAAALSKKGYWKQYDGSPDFVVMFLPGDQFVDAALARRPDLLEYAASQNVLLASPSTLIALLRAVHVGYQEQKLAREAMDLRDLGRELHDRAATAFKYAAQLGDAIARSVDKYNEFVGSYQSRLEPTLRRFEDAGVKSTKELPEVSAVTQRTRPAVTLMLDGRKGE